MFYKNKLFFFLFLWRLYTQKFNCEILGPRPKLLLLFFFGGILLYFQRSFIVLFIYCSFLLYFFVNFLFLRQCISFCQRRWRWWWWPWHIRGLISTWLFWGPLGHHNLGKVCCRKWRQRKWRHQKWRHITGNHVTGVTSGLWLTSQIAPLFLKTNHKN